LVVAGLKGSKVDRTELTNNSIDFPCFQVIGEMFEFVLIGFSTFSVGQVGDLEAFFVEMLEGCGVEGRVVGCYVEVEGPMNMISTMSSSAAQLRVTG
jgi:hypothetical protein